MSTTPPHDAPTREGLKITHTREAIRNRLGEPPRANYLRDFVYGAMDGAVTTFAVVSGAAGASLAPEIVLILGVANLVGDGFSMAAGNFLGTRADEQLRESAREIEMRHVAEFPEGEREEIRHIFESMGFRDRQLEQAVDVITSDRRRWIDIMLREEYGLPSTERSAIRAALSTFVAFLAIGAIPLLPFIWGWVAGGPKGPTYGWSTFLTAVAFFSVGAAKSRFVQQRWYFSGLETLLVGSAAALLAYAFGHLLGRIV